MTETKTATKTETAPALPAASPFNGEMIVTNQQGIASFTAQAAALVREMLNPKATDIELAFFASWCKRRNLDPFGGHVYLISRNNKALGRTVAKPELSIYGMLLEADRTEKYEGRTPYEWCGDDGVWTDVWLKKEPPVAARVGVHRAGAREPIWSVALWRHYASGNNPMWKSFDARMLGKCALAQALREAMPAELGDLYSFEEMQAATMIEAEVVRRDPISPESAIEIRELSKAAGVNAQVAERRLEHMTASDVEPAIAALKQRILEQDETPAPKVAEVAVDEVVTAEGMCGDCKGAGEIPGMNGETCTTCGGNGEAA